MNKFIYAYLLSTSYIPRFLRLFSYATKHISNTNGILKNPGGVRLNQIEYVNEKGRRKEIPIVS